MNRPLASPAERYTIVREIASGGMATVFLGRFAGPGGFSRLVAIKRPHPHVARHPEFRAMLLDEGRLAASIRHPNVVSTLDVVDDSDDLFLVMDYIPGRTLSELQRAVRKRGEALPPAIAIAIVHGVLLGLSAVHGARDDAGAPLAIVHRDVSPQNILVGDDGIARLLDFGVAKAAGRLQVTREGQLKGKISYMAPEQMQGRATHLTDIYAASIVLWEALTAERLFSGEDDVAIFAKALTSVVPRPSERARRAGVATDTLDASAWSVLDAVVLRGLSRDPNGRFSSATEMAAELSRCVPPASTAEVSAWLAKLTTANGLEEDVDAAGSSGATVADPRSGIATRTASAPAVVALQAAVTEVSSEPPTAHFEAPPPRRRPIALVVIAVVIGCALTGVWAMSSHTAPRPSAAPSSVALPTAASTETPSLPVADSVASAPSPDVSTPSPSALGAASVAPTSTPRARDAKKPPANRPSRPPVSPAIDVSHAIDARH